MGKKRSRILSQLALMAAILCLTACGGAASTSSSPGQVKTLLVGEQTGTATNLSFIVGIEQGFFKNHGLEVKRVAVGNAGVALSSLISGSVNVLSQQPTYVAQVDQQGNDLRFFCGNVAKNLAQLLIPGSGNLKPSSQIGWQSAIQQLKGAKIGVPARGGYPELLYNALFKDAGVTSPNVTYVATGVGQPAIVAFSGGDLQSMYAYAFISQQLVASGKARVLMDMSKDGPPILVDSTYVGFASTASWLTANKSTAQAYCAGLADSFAWIKNPKNSDALAKITSKEFGIDRSVLEQAQKSMFPLFDTRIDPKYLQNAIDFGVESGQVKAQPQVTADKLIFKL